MTVFVLITLKCCCAMLKNVTLIFLQRIHDIFVRHQYYLPHILSSNSPHVCVQWCPAWFCWMTCVWDNSAQCTGIFSGKTTQNTYCIPVIPYTWELGREVNHSDKLHLTQLLYIYRVFNAALQHPFHQFNLSSQQARNQSKLRQLNLYRIWHRSSINQHQSWGRGGRRQKIPKGKLT